MSSLRPRLVVERLGLVKYGAALIRQEQLAESRREGVGHDTLLVLQHHPVYTLGKRRTAHNILASDEDLKRIGAEVAEVNRGGDVTFHGPGQVVLYPIINLRHARLGARAFVEGLEDVMIKTASDYGLEARGRIPLQTGVWVQDRKIGAVGVQISRAVTTHGLAFNANPNLDFYSYIVPCGIPDKQPTSLEKECPHLSIDVELVSRQLVQNFLDVFSFESEV